MWNRIAICIKNTAKEIFRENRSSIPESKEMWWWDVEVQRIIVNKKKKIKVWYKSTMKENWTEYKKFREENKKAVSKAKYDEL